MKLSGWFLVAAAFIQGLVIGMLVVRHQIDDIVKDRRAQMDAEIKELMFTACDEAAEKLCDLKSYLGTHETGPLSNGAGGPGYVLKPGQKLRTDPKTGKIEIYTEEFYK